MGLRFNSRSWTGQAVCLICLLIGLGVCLPVANAGVTLTGVRKIPSATVDRWLTEIGARPTDEVARLLQERYRQHGYYDAVVTFDQADRQRKAAVLQVHEGAVVTFGDATVRLPGDFDGEFVRGLARSAFSGAASMENIEYGCSKIVQELMDAGRPFAQVSPTGFRRDENCLSLCLNVIPGPAVRVGAWRITGLQRSDTARVRKFLGLRTGMAWDREEKARVEERMQQCEYLIRAGEIRISAIAGDSLVEVEIPLAERPAVVTDGGLGFAGGGEGRQSVHGRLNLALENPFGDGRRLELLISRPTGEVSESRLRLSDPHVAGSRVGVHVEVRQFRQRETYDRISLATRGSIYLARGCYVSMHLGWSRITPLAGERSADPARSYDLTLSAQKNSRIDSRKMPRAQTTWELGLTASFRRQYRAAVRNQEKVRSRTRVLLAVEQRWRALRKLELRLAGKTESWLGPDADLGWGDELYLGGPETVRGLAERSQSSRGFGVLNAEIGYRPTAQLTAFLFSDLALFRPFAIGQPRRALHRAAGYGFGLELAGGFGRTRLEIGWPERQSLGDGIMYLRWLRGW